MTDEPSILERARALQARMEAERGASSPPTPPVPPQFDPDLIPDISNESSRTDEDRELDRILDGIDIVEAYQRWCGKMTPKVSPGRTESIMISCPKPEHADKNPSAWLNTEKQTWFCGGCQEGGDGYDIAAMRHGFPVPGYKEGSLFHKLRRAMAEDLGYTFNDKAGGGHEIVAPVILPANFQAPAIPAVAPVLAAVPNLPPLPAVVPAEVPSGEPVRPNLRIAEIQPDEEPDAVTVLPDNVRSIDAIADAYDPDLDSDATMPSFDWRSALAGQEDTFLYRWTEAASVGYAPEEYHVFSGLLVLGLCAGRDIWLGGARPVMANLPICFLGRTGSGKSTSQNYILKALLEIFPENDFGTVHEGVRVVGEVASGEALIASFQKVMQVSQGVAGANVPVKGYVEFSELATILAKASTTGSTLKPKIMDFIDGKDFISNHAVGTGKKAAKEPFAAFSTSSQPKALRKLLDGQDSASGYLNRWIYVAGQPKQQLDFIQGIPVDLNPALDKLALINYWVRPNGAAQAVKRYLPWNAEAGQAFNEWFVPINEMVKNADDDLLARLEFNYKKIILCHAVNRCANEIGLADLAFMMKLHPYMIQNYKLVGAEIGRTVGQEIVDRVYNFIVRKEVQLENGELIGPSRSEMNRALKTKNIQDKQINDAIDTLVKGGRIEEFKVNTGQRGRPTKRCRRIDHA